MTEDQLKMARSLGRLGLSLDMAICLIEAARANSSLWATFIERMIQHGSMAKFLRIWDGHIRNQTGPGCVMPR